MTRRAATRATSRAPRVATSPCPPMDHFTDLRSEMVHNLEKFGIQTQLHHHEVGSGGQGEIGIEFDTLAKIADKLMTFKYVVKNTAHAAGHTVTFMPKPIFGDNGSGMHTHQSLWKDGEPLFFDESGYGQLSDIARWYIGGLLAHAHVGAGVHQPDHQLLPAAGAGLRGAGQPGLLGPQPLGRRPHPGVGRQPEGQADRVPRPRPVVQPLPGVRGAADGRPRRHPQQDRAAGPGRQGHLRPAAGGAAQPAVGAALARGGARRASRATTSSCSRAGSSPRT